MHNKLQLHPQFQAIVIDSQIIILITYRENKSMTKKLLLKFYEALFDVRFISVASQCTHILVHNKRC